jgi:hypothetical protein
MVGRVQQSRAAHIMEARKKRERMLVLAIFFFLPLLFHLDPSLWDGANHIQGRSSR